MILSYRDRTNVLKTIGRLNSKLERLRLRSSIFLRSVPESWVEGEWMEKRIVELSRQYDDYVALLRESAVVSKPQILSEIPEYLIRRRIRMGLTQAEMAFRLGFSRKTILRYEKTRYAGASLSRILQIDCFLSELEGFTAREKVISAPECQEQDG